MSKLPFIIFPYRSSGGGSLWWQVGKNIHLDGLISAKGTSGSGSGGGGSGGSVLVETTNATGHGEINVNGGDSSSSGGAGAGGRIGVHVDFQNNFGGMQSLSSALDLERFN